MKKKDKKDKSSSKGVSKKILIGLTVLVLIVLIFFVIMYFINKIGMREISINDEMMSNVMNDVKVEQINYVFLEINPKFGLELKGSKVQKLWCMSKDCEKIKNKLEVTDKNLMESIEHIYNVSKDNGFSVSSGVKIQSAATLDEKIKELSYVKISYIGLEKQEELLKSIDDGNNNSIVSSKTNAASLLEKLKKDEDYGVIYECNNTATECYIKKDLNVSFDSLESYIKGQLPILYRIRNVLNRFGIKTESVKEAGLFEEPFFYIYLNGNKFTALNNERYLGSVNCIEYTIDLTEINLMNLGDVSTKLKPFEYSPFKDMKEEPEVLTDNCGDKWCAKHTNTATLVCNPGDKHPHVEYVDNYYIYTKDLSVDKEVTKEEWQLLDLKIGPMGNLPLCTLDDGNYINTSSTTYCRFRFSDSQRWSYIEPRR